MTGDVYHVDDSDSDSDIECIGFNSDHAQLESRRIAESGRREVEEVERSMSRITVSPAPEHIPTPTSGSTGAGRSPDLKRKVAPFAIPGESRRLKIESSRRSVRILGNPYRVVKGAVVGREGKRGKGETAFYASIQRGEQIIKVCLEDW